MEKVESTDPAIPEPGDAPRDAAIQMAKAELPQISQHVMGKTQNREGGGVKSLGFLSFEAQQSEFAPYLRTVRDLLLHDSGLPAHAILFGEDQGRYVVACPDGKADEIVARAGKAGVTARRLGTSGGRELTVAWAQAISLDTLRAAHEGWFPRFMGAAGG